MIVLNELQTNIMIYLSSYTYLSVSQLHVLTGRSFSYIRSQIALLAQKKLVKSFYVEIAKKRQENLYYLTSHGADCLVTHEKVLPQSLKAPRSDSVSIIGDYEHRKRCIDIQIAATRYFAKHDIELLFYQRYFDKTGNNRRDKNLESVTKIQMDNGQHYLPDSIFVTEYEGQQKLWIGELFNDRSSKRILTSLSKAAKVISLATASEKYKVNADAIILSAFSHSGIMEAVIQRLQAIENLKPIKELFFFGSVEELKKDFTEWKDIDGTPVQFR